MSRNPLRKPRRAFTLLEMLLVLALLVVVAAIAAPAIVGLSAGWRLKHAGEQLRTEWARARVAAMKSGRIHVFRYEIDGPRYQVEFWEADVTLLEAGEDEAVIAGEGPTEIEESQLDPYRQLPDGVRFVIGQIEESARSQSLEPQLGGASGRDVAWSGPILFYGDGTTSSAHVMLANDRGRALSVTLRGLTGIARVGESETREELRR